MSFRSLDKGTLLCIILTVLVFVIDATCLILASQASQTSWLSFENLDHIGSFLSGSLTPIAIAWAARSLFLQRDDSARAVFEAEAADRRAVLAAEPAVNVVLGWVDTTSTHHPRAELRVEHGGGSQPLRVIAYWLVREHGSTVEFKSGRVESNGKAPDTTIKIAFPDWTTVTPSAYDAWVMVRLQRADKYASLYFFEAKAGFNFNINASVIGLAARRWSSINRSVNFKNWPQEPAELVSFMKK